MTFPVLPIIVSGTAVSRTEIPRNPEKPAVAAQTPRIPPVEPETKAGGTLHVVVVGISNYSQSSMNLKYAANDAEAIADLLVSRGSALFSSLQKIQLLDQQATRRDILTAIESISKTAGADDTLAVFLAGHGAMVGQRYYFIPADFQSDAAALEDSIRQQGIAADEISDAIAKVVARQKLVIFDTCASGGAIQLTKQQADPFAFRSAIEQFGKSGGTFTLAAVGASQEAHEVDELKHGILTYCLMAGAGAADGGPLQQRMIESAGGTHVDVLEWFNYAAGHVPRLTRHYFSNEQQVQIGGTGKAFLVFRRTPVAPQDTP